MSEGGRRPSTLICLGYYVEQLLPKSEVTVGEMELFKYITLTEQS